MSKLIKTRAAQCVLSAEFIFNFDDTMVNVAGTEKDFGKTAITTTDSYDVIPIPKGAIVVGGEVIRPTAFDTAGYAMTVGDSTTANRYLASTDVKAAGRTALVPTGYVSDGESLRIGITNTDVCTAGKCIVRLEYIVPGKVDQVAL